MSPHGPFSEYDRVAGQIRNAASRPDPPEHEPEQLHPVVQYVTERHLDIYGGYPLPGRWIGDTFAWCHWDYETNGKWSEIYTITRPEMDAWLERAREYARERGWELALPPADGRMWMDIPVESKEAFDETEGHRCDS